MANDLKETNRRAALRFAEEIARTAHRYRLTLREAACHAIGGNATIDLDRLDAVVGLAQDADFRELQSEPSREFYIENAHALEDAIAGEWPVLFFYRRPPTTVERGSGVTTDAARWRHVSPYVLEESARSGEEYVVAWDHDEESIRNFRLDRIEGLVVQDTAHAYRPKIEEV